MNINSKSCLLITDPHQNISWVKSILEKEKGNYDYIIFGGDFFDSFYSYPVVASVGQTADFVLEVLNGKYGPATVLNGNHSSPYMESRKSVMGYHSPKYLYTKCSGYTNNKSKDINKILSDEHWIKFEPFCVCNGYLISHAGFAKKFWNDDLNTDENLTSLYKEGKKGIFDLLYTKNTPGRFYDLGFARGGRDTVGGVFWLDWDCEFLDYKEIGPQIVGHSSVFNCIRKKDKSYCLDGMQTTYAILHDTGQLELKSMVPDLIIRDDSDLNQKIIDSWKY